MNRTSWGSALALGAWLVACGASVPASLPDLSRPEGPVAALIDAAKHDDPRYLAGLCAPASELDSDARRVCRAGDDEDDWELIEGWFESAAIRGAPRVDGERAELDVSFGPDAERHATFTVTRREGKWHLSAF